MILTRFKNDKKINGRRFVKSTDLNALPLHCLHILTAIFVLLSCQTLNATSCETMGLKQNKITETLQSPIASYRKANAPPLKDGFKRIYMGRVSMNWETFQSSYEQYVSDTILVASNYSKEGNKSGHVYVFDVPVARIKEHSYGGEDFGSGKALQIPQGRLHTDDGRALNLFECCYIGRYEGKDARKFTEKHEDYSLTESVSNLDVRDVYSKSFSEHKDYLERVKTLDQKVIEELQLYIPSVSE